MDSSRVFKSRSRSRSRSTCCVVILLVALVSGLSRLTAAEEHSSTRLDVFHELAGHDEVLSTSSLQQFVDGVFLQLKCTEDDHHDDEDDHDHDDEDDHDHEGEDHCELAACINATDILLWLGAADNATGVDETQFATTSEVVLYYVTSLQTVCHAHVNLSTLTQAAVTRHLLNVTQAQAPDYLLTEPGMQAMLEGLLPFVSHEHHGHGTTDQDDHADDHDDDDHADDDHANDDHADDHHANDDHADDDHADDDHADDDHADDDHADDDHADDDHDHDHDDDATEVEIVEEKCLSADAILYYTRADTIGHVTPDRLSDVAALTLYLLHQGSHIEEKCRLYPTEEAFVDNIYGSFATGPNNTMVVTDVDSLMTELKINPATTSEDHSDHSDHDHRRRRRSVTRSRSSVRAKAVLQRRKRDAVAVTDSEFAKCYSADELVALFEGQSGISPDRFEQLCPALLSQSIYGECTQSDHHDDDDDPSDTEMYLYGTIATAIICLCSIFGAVFVTCTGHHIYQVIMSTMMGLAVGTLFADAVLHLIPQAMGIHLHDHDHDHDHSDDIEVEEYVSYGLIILAGLYLFYLLETFMTRFGGHSHHEDHGNGSIEINGFSNIDTPTKMSEEDGLKAVEGKKKFMTPIALMIIVGDAIHNFADGLAMGAAFASSTSDGVATSIAVFCHELPHELGDFAVLIQTGMGFKKAIAFNLLSSLTAFIGLYVGLVISDDPDNRRWIFALAAGMFIYIALVDLLPQLIKASASKLEFILINVGILTGYLAMFLIAIFEDHIEIWKEGTSLDKKLFGSLEDLQNTAAFIKKTSLVI